MKIRMYECGFGDCFRLREQNQVDLYVDFGIHKNSWAGNDKKIRFDGIIADMDDEKDFLLTHYHEDHFNGAIYMAKNTSRRFNDVYISDVWNMPGSVYIISLTLLRGIFTKSVMLGQNTLIDFLESICTKHSRIHFISRGMKFHNDQYIALWPEKNYVARKAQRMFEKLQDDLGSTNLERIERIANQLNVLVVTMANSGQQGLVDDVYRFNELREEYLEVQESFDNLYGSIYNRNFQYKLTNFGNETSIVFQNYKGDRNVLFTGDFGKKRNWTFIENNKDGLVDMHSYYEIIKIPHHGTKSYYHSFVGKIKDTSTLLIPNGYLRQNLQSWYVNLKYKSDFVTVKNKTVCTHNATCLGSVCPKGRCIYPNLYLDI